jgi:hypothetical protein
VKRFLCFLVFLFLGLTAAHAERRVALVIGNSGYQHVATLKNPFNDAKGMSEKLSDLGFEVVTGQDLTLRDMRQTIRKFIGTLDGADLALFFYAGHGLQVSGENYLLPVDAELDSHLDLEFEALPANLVLNAMEQTAKVNIVFLDACRNNPFTENLARSMGTRSSAVGRGLAKIGSGVGSLISFATQPGNVAQDGDGENSPFTTALLKHLGTPGQDITRDLVMVRRDVLDATRGQQVPWDNSSLTGEVILKAEEQVEVAAPVAPETPAVNPQIELTYWDTIKNGESVAYFETYLQRYPEGQFADIARIRIDEIKTRTAETKSRQAQPDTSAEIAFWQSIQNATRPEMYESYLAQYPSGIYAGLARLKIDAIRQAEAAKKAQVASSAVQAAPEKQSGAESITVAALTPADTASKEASVPSVPSELSRSLSPEELASAMQTELNRLGCPVGRVDGDWGNRSRGALKTFGREAGIELASLDPDAAVLDLLKKSTGRICPLTCGRNQELKNGRCVAVRTEAPSTGTTKPKTETKAASNCPSNPSSYGNATIGMAHGAGRQTLTHPCGRKMACRGSRASWILTCNWL